MKKAVLFALTTLTILAINQANAAGLYDGIWQVSESGFATLNQNGNSVIITELDLDEGDFSVTSGTLINNEAVFSTIYGNVSATYRIVFNSLTTATLTVLSCIPDPTSICNFSAGTSILLTKVF